MKEVQIVRIYLSESGNLASKIIDHLHNKAKIKGVTVFRGISGFGDSGTLHATSLLDLSLDLPIVVEFFESPKLAQAVIDDLKPLIKPGHLVTWLAQVNE